MENNHSVIDIEKSLLGLILIEKKAIVKVRGLLVPADFFDKRNAIIFQSFNNLLDQNSEIELPLLLADINKNNLMSQAGGIDYISSLVSEAGLFANIDSYVKAIADKSQLRKVQNVLKGLNKEVDKNDADAEILLEKVEQEILSATRDVQSKDFRTSKDVISSAIFDIEQRSTSKGLTGIPSEYPSLDKITSGFQNGDLIILAARPSMGKTAFALNLAANAAKAHKVAVFSLEMPSEQLFKRILGFTSFVDGYKITNPSLMGKDDFNKIYAAEERIKDLEIFVDDSPGLKLSELMWKARKLNKNVGIDLIVIDYLQLLTVGNTASNSNRQAEVALISRTLKQLARELNIPVIALSQLSRDVEKRENKTPMMSDLRESGAIEQDADIIAFLYRDAYYHPEKHEDKKHQQTDIIISKHRNGAIGKVQLTFNPNLGLFTDVNRGDK